MDVDNVTLRMGIDVVGIFATDVLTSLYSLNERSALYVRSVTGLAQKYIYGSLSSSSDRTVDVVIKDEPLGSIDGIDPQILNLISDAIICSLSASADTSLVELFTKPTATILETDRSQGFLQDVRVLSRLLVADPDDTEQMILAPSVDGNGGVSWSL